MVVDIDIDISIDGVKIGSGSGNISDTDLYRIISDLEDIILFKDLNGNSGFNFTIPRED